MEQGGYACGGRGIWEIFVPFSQFCSEPETSLKNEVLKKCDDQK